MTILSTFGAGWSVPETSAKLILTEKGAEKQAFIPTGLVITVYSMYKSSVYLITTEKDWQDLDKSAFALLDGKMLKQLLLKAL